MSVLTSSDCGQKNTACVSFLNDRIRAIFRRSWMVGDQVGGRKTSHRVQSQCHVVGMENVSKEELITLWEEGVRAMI